MKHQALFSSKDEIKKYVLSAAILLSSLRVNIIHIESSVLSKVVPSPYWKQFHHKISQWVG